MCPFLTPRQSWLETLAAEEAGSSSPRALPWVPSPSCQGPVPPQTEEIGFWGKGGVCCSEASERGGAGWPACSPRGIVCNLIYGSLHCPGSASSPGCVVLPTLGHGSADWSSLLLWPRPKPALSPGTWSPKQSLVLATTGKSRLRVPKIPPLPKQIMDLPLKG